MIKHGVVFLTLLTLMLLAPGRTSAAMLHQAAFVVNSRSCLINGTVVQMDAAPYIEQGRVMIPLRDLARALGVADKNITWDDAGQSVELQLSNKQIKLTVNSRILVVNEQSCRMDVAPVLRDGRVFLPARWVAEALGYATGWAEKKGAVLIGLPGYLPDPATIPLKIIPVNIRACAFATSDLWLEQKRSASAILFHGDYANVYNAGVAAKYVHGFILEPGCEFSFNRTVGERTTTRGFITGFDILDNLTVGGGVCRTSTVLFQAARDAGFDILERHPHYRPVHYTPPGTDASVSWGWMDLRFKNNLPRPVIIYAGLMEETSGRRLWAEIWERIPLKKMDVAVLIQEPGACWAEKIEKERLTALEKEGVVYVSLEQLSDLLRLVPEIELQGGVVSASVKINNQLINFIEGNKTATINGTAYQLQGVPFSLSGSNCTFWLPLQDWAALTQAEIMWVDGAAPFILFNLSGIRVMEEKL